jgi:S-adenosylmethionine hydrolase
MASPPRLFLEAEVMAESSNKIITLTTDFGTADGYSGVIKGVILSVNSVATIIDITHGVKQFDIRSAAWIIRNAYKFFPNESIHMVIVDPKVGSAQRPIVITSPVGTFVGPDNGTFSMVTGELPNARAYELTEKRYWLPITLSHSFHARDLYGPTCAHLSMGVPAAEMGRELAIDSLKRLDISEPVVSALSYVGEIVYIDHYGNLITNIPNEHAASLRRCYLGNRFIGIIEQSYASVPRGSVAVIEGSHGYIEIAVNQGRAVDLLMAKIGQPVRLAMSETLGPTA